MNANDFNKLQSVFGANISVITVEGNQINGLLSNIIKIAFKQEDKLVYVVLKKAFKDQVLRSKLSARGLFLREMYVYNVLYPVFEAFQRENNVQVFSGLPKCYKTFDAEYDELLVLKDMNYEKFYEWNSTTLLTDAHLVVIMKACAKFHAISFAMQHKDLQLYDKYTKNLDNQFSPRKFAPTFFESFGSTLNIIETLFNSHTEANFISAIRKLQDNYMDFFHSIDTANFKHQVVCHGDFWYKNIMFKYDNNTGQPSDACFFDFQHVRVGNPVLDLSYIIYSGAECELLNNLKHYLAIYNQVLKQQMIAHRFRKEIYCYAGILDDWKKYSKFGYLLAMDILVVEEAMRYNNTADISQTKEIVLNNFDKSKMSQSAIHRLKEVTKHMYFNGCL